MSRLILLFAVAACACLVPSLAAAQTLPKAQHQMSKAETARLGAKTEAQGFLNLNRYAHQRYAAQTAQLGAKTEAQGFLNLAAARQAPPRRDRTARRQTRSSGLPQPRPLRPPAPPRRDRTSSAPRPKHRASSTSPATPPACTRALRRRRPSLPLARCRRRSRGDGGSRADHHRGIRLDDSWPRHPRASRGAVVMRNRRPLPRSPTSRTMATRPGPITLTIREGVGYGGRPSVSRARARVRAMEGGGRSGRATNRPTVMIIAERAGRGSGRAVSSRPGSSPPPR